MRIVFKKITILFYLLIFFFFLHYSTNYIRVRIVSDQIVVDDHAVGGCVSWNIRPCLKLDTYVDNAFF